MKLSKQIPKLANIIVDNIELIDEEINAIKKQIEYIFRSRKYVWRRKIKLPKYKKKKQGTEKQDKTEAEDE